MKFTDNKQRLMVALLLLSLLPLPQLACARDNTQTASGYVAQNETIKGVFDALSSRLGKPVLLSKNALRKKVSGDFDLSQPQQLLNTLSEQLGLIWYHDGQTLYVYDADEMRHAVIALHNVTSSALNNYLVKAELYDKRYALRADNGSGTIYVSGPPVYVELVSNVAHFLDEKKNYVSSTDTKVAVIQLFNTFVEDRHYKYRDEDITIPGVANVLRNLMTAEDKKIEVINTRDTTKAEPEKLNIPPAMPDFDTENIKVQRISDNSKLDAALAGHSSAGALTIIANPGNNSLLVKGSAEQVDYVQSLVSNLDVKKRHIELSVWIVDLQKDALDQLGVEWGGNINLGTQLSASLNGGSASTVDGARFMAAILGLRQKGRANIIARPMILTQENIPAIFDNSRTFYTKLIGERSVELQHVTYGTSINVLPRFTESDEVEMMLTVEDGNAAPVSTDEANNMPEVGRTNISTVARVPRGKSLLIGGYTRNESSADEAKLPLLGDIPWIGGAFRYHKSRDSNMVRVFLIQPSEIREPLEPDASQLVGNVKKRLGDENLQDWLQNYLDARK